MTISRSLSSFIIVAVLAACSQSSSSQASTITASGSTALQPLVEQAAQDYMASHPNLKIDVSGGGSGQGIKDVASGAVDIGDSDVDASVANLDDHQVAVIAFAVVVGPNVGIDSLSRSQIADVFNGKIANWKQVGGHDQPVVLIFRKPGSGTRHVFSSYFLGGAESKGNGTVEDSSQKVAQRVKNTAGAISYVGYSYARQYNVPIMRIDGVEPSIANVKNHSYGFWSYEHMYTATNPSAAIEGFIEFVKNDDAVLDKLGFFAIKDVAEVAPASSGGAQ